jgi:hypothetical protein
MSSDNRPNPPVELSQKFMAWNIKSMDENLKTINMYVKSIAESLKAIAETFKIGKGPTSTPQQPQVPLNQDQIPF